MPLVPVLATVEDNGVKIDKEFLAVMNKKVGEKNLGAGKKYLEIGRRGIQYQFDPAIERSFI